MSITPEQFERGCKSLANKWNALGVSPRISWQASLPVTIAVPSGSVRKMALLRPLLFVSIPTLDR